MKLGRILIAAVLLLIGFMFLNNTNLFTSPAADHPSLIAHRGLAQLYDRTALTTETCTATRMLPTGHDYIENTLPSMKAAFDLGADIVEFDIHPTTDGHFAVFHDWTIDCRTEDKGVTRTHALADLRKLDIGHGYTADGGKTFPFRGKGVGMMPSLDEVLAAFPDKNLLINIKSNDPNEGSLLADVLAKLPAERQARLLAYGGNAPITDLSSRLPALHVMSRASLKECFLRYFLIGWTGYVPQACRNSLLLVPANIGPWLWGWPHVLQKRLTAVKTHLIAVGPYDGADFSSGIDSASDLKALPADYAGGIWTNRIDLLSKLIADRRPAR